MLKIGIVAGESSGDQLGAQLINGLRKLYPDVSIYGMAGPKMRAAGCQALADIDELSVMGIAEVLAKYPALRRLRTRLLAELTSLDLDVFIGIDVPDFVHYIEGRLKQSGVKTVHYVAPQVWAWRPKRARQLSSIVDLLLVLFPFEIEFFNNHNVNTKFVGHPLVERIPENIERQKLIAALELNDSARYIALMPGSRKQELRRHVDLFLQTAMKLALAHPEHKFLVAAVNNNAKEFIEGRVATLCPNLDFRVLVGQSHQLLGIADVALVVSGTATMEALCSKTPTVVAIRVAGFSYQILSRMLTVPFVAMPNILAGKKIIPEFVQDEATVENLAQAVTRWLSEPDAVEGFRLTCGELRNSLRVDESRSAAHEIARLL